MTGASLIEPERETILCDVPVRPDGRFVLYWMQQSQRASFNPALERAVEYAADLGLPVLVAFGLTAFPEATARHYDFMLRGLAEVRTALARRGIGFVIRREPPHRLVHRLAEDAALVVCDRGYLRIQRAWRAEAAKGLGRRLVQVEGDVVAPVETASDHHEVAARTLRPKLLRLLDRYLHDLPPRPVAHRAGPGLPVSDVDLDDIPRLVAGLRVDQAVGPVRRFTPGETAARERLAAFAQSGLARYGEDRGRPEAGVASQLSPYLHFGQISPVEIALAARSAALPDGAAKYLDELVVRRELAVNHAWYAPHYDRFDVLPAWARRTLADHAGDPRPHLYGRAQIEAGETHDPDFNAAMLEMTATGYMHNALRMYWGKKILQWSASPEEAWETALALNNRWFLDGRDPSSFANVGWLFGLHDRPWGPQPVFGTVRSMGPNVLKKFDAAAYRRQVSELAGTEPEAAGPESRPKAR